MIALNRIYTRTGDDGTTGLVTGERRPKNDLRVEAYGTVDEVNACVGVARCHAAGSPELDAALQRIQHDLFDLGSDLATPQKSLKEGRLALRITERHVTRLEQELDHWNERLLPLRSFVLPGGTPSAAALHLARAVARRAERVAVALTRTPGEDVSPLCVHYLNRLSDFLFVLARVANNDGRDDVLWEKGKNIGSV
ncbi:MAG: cob(I)yrinic acid a,c-diamide adenosyltransferase [Methylobacteriaceae bacterium]|jgi:cob(I)alamin adenosyltransferase|nr:cob(I)yrinic acid a,c-diamide adenosyltransferase [Methylobacteriaceae bacterium]